LFLTSFPKISINNLYPKLDRRRRRRRRRRRKRRHKTTASTERNKTKTKTTTTTMSGSASAREQASRARKASRELQNLQTKQRNELLENVAKALEQNTEKILLANKQDLDLIERNRDDDDKEAIDQSLVQRLRLSEQKIKNLCDGLRQLSAMEEPIGKVLEETEIAEQLKLEKVTSPIGVLLIIFESRPDALVQICGLCIRTGNGLLLKGGKEAARSNAALHEIIVREFDKFEVNRACVSLITGREEIKELLELNDVIDLCIPRGGNALVTYIQNNTKIPVLGHADGVCHIYCDKDLDVKAACEIIVDSKTDYCAACNAMETLLIHENLVKLGVHNELLDALVKAKVELFGGDRASSELNLPKCEKKRLEYGRFACTVEIVKDMDEAIDYIHANGSSHTDCILTADANASEEFLRKVDSACVFSNCSTRFSDGFRFGYGAEVGVSTSRIHARGPVGVDGLLTTRCLLRGKNQSVKKDSGVQYTHIKHKSIGLPKHVETKGDKIMKHIKLATSVLFNVMTIISAINTTKKKKPEVVDSQKKRVASASNDNEKNKKY
jgi:delta-1-pyrroline-5-carboxylate synthetase